MTETNDWMAQSLTKDDFREGVRSFIESDRQTLAVYQCNETSKQKRLGMRPSKTVDLGEEIIEHTVLSNRIALNVLELAPKHRSKASIIMLHGLRDSAHALLPVAQRLAEHFHVLLPELRGHGRSDRSDAYGIFDFVHDLHEVIEALAGDVVGLFGHSLGGHIVSKYAAVFPQKVAAVAIIQEGKATPTTR